MLVQASSPGWPFAESMRNSLGYVYRTFGSAVWSAFMEIMTFPAIMWTKGGEEVSGTWWNVIASLPKDFNCVSVSGTFCDHCVGSSSAPVTCFTPSTQFSARRSHCDLQRSWCYELWCQLALASDFMLKGLFLDYYSHAFIMAYIL